MKKYLALLLCVAGVALFAGCNKDKLKDKIDNLDVQDIYDWEGAYNRTNAGIYMKGNELLAKGSDGSVFHIDDVTDLATPLAAGVPPFYPAGFSAWDGKTSAYNFGMDCYTDIDDNWQTYTWRDTVAYCHEYDYSTATTVATVDIMKLGFTVYFSEISLYTKVAEAGNFEATYRAIAQRVQKKGPIVSPANMVRSFTKYDCSGWLSNLYPQDMETKKYVIPYTGTSGNVYETSIYRDFHWGIPGEHVIMLPSTTSVDQIFQIKVHIKNVTEADAMAFINKVKTEGFYSQVVTDSAVEGGGYGFEANCDNYYDEGVHGPAPSGTNAYISPAYSVAYAPSGDLVITFEVTYMTFV